jgi:hypothetical protein
MNFIRKTLPVLLPNLVVQTVWIVVMSQHNLWEKFRDNYFISIMMIFGSFVAGATSEGIVLEKVRCLNLLKLQVIKDPPVANTKCLYSG